MFNNLRIYTLYTWVTDKIWYMAKGHPKVGWAPIVFAVAAPCTNLPEGIVLGIILGWAPIGFAAMANPTTLSILLWSYLILSDTWIWKVFLLHLQASPFASPWYSNRYGISTGRSAGSSAKNTRGPHYVNRSFANGWPKFNCAPSVSHVRQAEPIRSARRAHSAPSTFPWHARVLDVCRWKLEVEFEGLRWFFFFFWKQTYHNLQNFSNFSSLRKKMS